MSNSKLVQSTTPLYLDEKTTARSYGFSIPWLRKRRRLGLAPRFYRVNRMVRYAREDLRLFLAEHAVEPQATESDHEARHLGVRP